MRIGAELESKTHLWCRSGKHTRLWSIFHQYMSRHISYSVGHLYDPFHLEGVKERAWGETGVIGREGDKGRHTT
ncbi:hypothetical protein Y032_0332g2748 [Ancylostoma ceylanicum]|uniref:Uncharacterized protein n=1 Tax=Ancylostoma ceylanicum TaxID=53326 RepID=A0A016S047_9BILA|nr:hypothetical protein Y032_0332g2748 [Ancylostoma ceylanicum]